MLSCIGLGALDISLVVRDYWKKDEFSIVQYSIFHPKDPQLPRAHAVKLPTHPYAVAGGS